MVLLDKLPTDSVLRRHAITERLRALGLPPTDVVLRRHHDQLVASLEARAAAAEAARLAPPARAAAPIAPAISPPARPAPQAAPVAAPSGGGLFGWLRRLLGLN